MSKCSAEMYDPTGRGNWRRCSYRSKMHHKGKGYCGIHDPVKKAARAAEQRAKWSAAFKARAKADMDRGRKLDSWDGLVAACELASGQEECVCEGKGECLGCVLQAALKAAKAPSSAGVGS